MVDLFPDRQQLAQEAVQYKKYIEQQLRARVLAIMTAWCKACGAWFFEDSPGAPTFIP